MSGREQDIFSFETGEWVADLITRFKNQLKNHGDRLGSQIEQHILSVHAETISGLSSKDKRAFKAHLMTEISQISNSLSMFLNDTLSQQSSILEKYLNEHVFCVPGAAVLAISPLDVPIPAKVVEDPNKSTSAEINNSKKAKEAPQSEEEKNESLRTVLTNIHKTEYFLSRLKQLHNENERYISVLEGILTSLLQLDETTKNRDTESSAKAVLETLDSSMAILSAIQAELDSKNITHDLKVPSSVTPAP